MGLIRKILGARSKYQKELPYTYEARVAVTDDGEITNSLLSDTICGLVEHLKGDGVDPSGVEIREVYQGREAVIDPGFYTGEDGGWLARPAICESFRVHYPGHIDESNCSFSDRDDDVVG